MFRVALPILPYRDPVVYKSVDCIPSIVESGGYSRPLVITDADLYNCGVASRLTDVLDGAGITYSLFKDVVFNPTTATVERALSVYNAEKCDCIIAFGGGSPMDTAKAVGARVARPKKSLAKMKGILKVGKKIPFLIAVPTTCGTGSETTLAAVIVDEGTRHKYAINDFPLIPKAAVLDASLLDKLPPKLVAYTGLDALTHAIEAYIGRSTTRTTRSDALRAIKLVFENLQNAVEGESAALSEMLVAAHLAGRAFSKSYVGYVHALAHALGGKYNVAHGFANAVLLPTVLDEYGSKIYAKLAKAAKYCGMADDNADKTAAAKSFLDRLSLLEESLGIPRTFDCIRQEDIAELSRYAAKEANPLYPVPVLWNEKRLAEIYGKVSAL